MRGPSGSTSRGRTSASRATSAPTSSSASPAGSKAEPHLVVNIEGRGATAEEAAAWVEYVNGPATTTQGAVRARNGSPEPFAVKTWELGNEIWGDWVRGHSDADTYARNYLRYRDAMLAVDPSLRLIAVGDNDMAWNRAVLGRIGPRLDYLALHHYYGLTEQEREPANLMARPLVYERFYKDVARVARGARSRARTCA